MKRNKIIALALSAALVLSVFTGCSADTESTDSSSSQTQQTDFSVSVDLSSHLDENGYIKDINFEDAVNLADYQSLVIPKENHQPTQEDIEAEMRNVLINFGKTTEIKEGVVEDGATLNIDYTGYVDGVAFEGGSTNGAGTEVTIGVTQYIDDFLQQLVGKNIGDNFDIEVTFPEDYQMSDLAGKDATFNITINYVKGADLADFTDEFCAENLASFGTETKDSAVQYITDYLSDNMVRSYVYQEVFGKSTVENLPENAFNFQRDYLLANAETTAKNYGMTLEDYLASGGFASKDEFIQENSSVIEDAAKELMVLQAIAKNENMTVSQEDLQEQYGENLETSKELYGENFLKIVVLQNKVLKLIEEETPRA